MKYILVLVLIFSIIGCREPDKDELKKINGIKVENKKPIQKKSLFDDVKVESNKIDLKKDIIKIAKKQEPKKEAPKELKKEIVIVKKVDEFKKQKFEAEQNIKKIELANRQKMQENEFKLKQKEKDYAQQRVLFDKKNRYKTMQIALALVVLALLFIALLVYFYKRRKTDTNLSLEREKFHREKDLELYKLQNQRLEKIVDIVTTKDLSKENEAQLLNIISEETRTNVIEVEPKKKGLFFKS